MQSVGKIKQNILNAAILAASLFSFSIALHANVTANTKTVSFGSQAIGTTSAPITVTVTNDGKDSVKTVSVSLPPSQFLYSGPTLPVTLGHGQSLNASIKFEPIGAQRYAGALIFTRHNSEKIEISVRGTGIEKPDPIAAQPPVQAPPIIATQPLSQTIIVGKTATFSVSATGSSPMTYQWKNGATAISGATSSTYTTPAETASGTFSVTVSNSAGSATSNAAVLTVNAAVVAPTITTQPASQTITSGQTATFSVAATGSSPMTYQWKNGATAISGATSSTYTTPAETASGTFSVTVSNSAGSVTSNPATLTVNAGTLLLNSSSSSLNFGNVNVSSNSSQNVTLTNAGNSSVTISGVSISGAGFGASGVPTGTILAPGQTATLTATFDPSAAGNMTGSVTVASNASNSPDKIALSGTGVSAPSESVALSWTASTSVVTGYNTYSSTTSGGPYNKLTSTPVSGTSYSDTTVQPGQTYYYVVTSVDSANGESAYSMQVSAVIP